MAHVGTGHRRFRLLRRITRIVLRVFFWLAALFGVVVFLAFMLLVRFGSSQKADPEVVRRLREAASSGQIAYHLTEPNELIRLLGRPTGQSRAAGREMEKTQLRWPGVSADFMRVNDRLAVPTLRWIRLGGIDFSIGDYHDNVGATGIDIGIRRPIALRDGKDLRKLDMFIGLQGLSLTKLDLRDYQEALLKLPFDNRTRWPAKDKLPEGFDPNALLEGGKNPGLGVRALHAEGIDGRGVGIAIIDQPLLEDHVEYAGQVVRYEKLGIAGKLASPQMHGPAVASIAVGKTCGVAPRASLHFFVFMSLSMPGNKAYSGIVDKILRLNERLPASEKIRVISISYGMFSHLPRYEQWARIVERAKQHGVLVVTCDAAFLNYGTLARLPGTNPDDPANYQRGRFSTSRDDLYIPAGHRTIASEKGSSVYKYDPTGGMSWCAPYLAGLAAMAFQLDPDIDPDLIVKLFVSTSTETKVGHIINPPGFIEAVKKQAKAKPQRSAGQR